MRTINRERILSKAGHVVVLMGGDSPEREISLLSGKAVCESLEKLGVHFDAVDVGDDVFERLRELNPDIALNMLHGQRGEDGVIQGMLEMMGIPYTGSGVLASALAMDKVKSKLIWRQAGLNTADFVLLQEDTDWDSVISQFGSVVIKPVNGGSSLGISIVDNADSLRTEFTAARKFDQHVMAEQYIKGPEYSTGVIGEELFPTILLETDRQFFDYEAKYFDSATRIICPVDMEAEALERLEALVRDAYSSLGCKGLARVDVMQNEAGEFFLLELNTVPGMTSHSFVPTAASKVGISFEELVLRILEAELGD